MTIIKLEVQELDIFRRNLQFAHSKFKSGVQGLDGLFRSLVARGNLMRLSIDGDVVSCIRPTREALEIRRTEIPNNISCLRFAQAFLGIVQARHRLVLPVDFVGLGYEDVDDEGEEERDDEGDFEKWIGEEEKWSPLAPNLFFCVTHSEPEIQLLFPHGAQLYKRVARVGIQNEGEMKDWCFFLACGRSLDRL